jgi:hypothetical protein
MIGQLRDSKFQATVTNQPSKIRSDFHSTEDYFQHLASNLDDLKITLAQYDQILDTVDETTGNTLLHLIAEGKPREYTFAVEPYLTDKRVAAQNQKGNTVLHNHIKFIGNIDVWRQTLSVYLNHSNGGATLSIQNEAGDTALSRLYMYKPWDPDGRHPSVTDRLLSKGLPNLDLNAQSSCGGTALCLSLLGNRYDDAIKLLDNGASPVFHGENPQYSAENILKVRQQQIIEKIDSSFTNDELEKILKGSSISIIYGMQEQVGHKEAFVAALEKLNLIEAKIKSYQ